MPLTPEPDATAVFAGALLAGPLTDRFGRKALLIVDALIYAIGALLSAVSWHVSVLLIARTMIKYDLGVGLNVPVRVAVHEDPATKKVRVSYNLPSSLMSALANDDVSKAAKGLDAKLIALAEKVTGVAA